MMAGGRVRAERRLDLALFPPSVRAEYIDRPNRFIVRARLDGRTVRAYLPNPGRLGEILLPGARLRLILRGGRHTAVAVECDAGPIILDTGRTNAIARDLLQRRLVPGLERARIIRSEAPHGRSRFDFLLDLDGEPFWLEVKSVTLLAGRTAMFPDAVTERGKRHIEELAQIALGGGRAGVLFIVHHPQARAFAPDWHTDPAFAEAFLRCAPHIAMWAIPIRTGDDLRIASAGDPLPIPIETIRSEISDRGAYVVLLRLRRAKAIDIGSLGRIRFPAGFYGYAGSAARILTARVARHRRIRKRLRWHIDLLRAEAFHDLIARFRTRAIEEAAP